MKALEGMVADGSLHGYHINRQAIHTSDINSFLIVLFTNGPEGLDRYSAVVESMGKNDPAGLAGFESIVNDAGHQDGLYRVPSMTSK